MSETQMNTYGGFKMTVTELNTWINVQLVYIRSGIDKINILLQHYRDDLRGINASAKDYTVEGQNKRMADLESKALATLANIEGELRSNWNTITAKLTELQKEGSYLDTNRQLLAEIQEQRAWSRFKPLLDVINTSEVALLVQKLTEEAVSDNDRNVYYTFVHELPRYLESRKAHPDLIKETIKLVTDTAAPLREASQVRARELAELFPKQWTYVENDLYSARTDIQERVGVGGTLFNWDGEVISTGLGGH